MEPEQYLSSYGWQRGKTRWSHPNFHGWFTTEEAVQAQADVRRGQLAFELGFNGDVKRLLRAVASMQRHFPPPLPTAGYPSRYEAVCAYVEVHPEAKAAAIGMALNISTKHVYEALSRRKRRLARKKPAPPPPKAIEIATSQPTASPAKVALLANVSLPVARAAVEAGRTGMESKKNKRARALLPMLFGRGDRRENCTGYKTCMDRAARLARGDEHVHCPVDCAEFEPVDRKMLLNELARLQPL